MTTPVDTPDVPRATPGHPSPSGFVARPIGRKSGRIGTILILIAGLLCASFTRPLAMYLQDQAVKSGPYGGGKALKGGAATLGGMDSFFLALLLGGFRGPLVMLLWSSSESQKNERDLEDFDTKVELIRLLQPEFITVQLFQIWNKAYNISAQMASLPNKYAEIVDAVRYAKSVDAALPNEINIQLQLAQVYASKLGDTRRDKAYYIPRVREETKYRPNVAAARGQAARRLDPILDINGNLLPSLYQPPRPRPTGLKAKAIVPAIELDTFKDAAKRADVTLPQSPDIPVTGEATFQLSEADARKVQAIFDPRTPMSTCYIYSDAGNGNGGELQYLLPYQPFPYGVPPQALGYNYSKRAQVLMTVDDQQPLQTSTHVADSRPPLDLRSWSEEEGDRAIEAEIKAFGKKIPSERWPMELPTAGLTPDQPFKDNSVETRAQVDEALFEFQRSADLAVDAVREFHRHLSNGEYAFRSVDYSVHLDMLTAQWFLANADRDYLKAMTLPTAAEKKPLLEKARDNYRLAIYWLHLVELKNYTEPAMLRNYLPPGPVPKMLLLLMQEKPEAIKPIFDALRLQLRQLGPNDANSDTRAELEPYWNRATQRIEKVNLYLSANPA